MKPFRYSEITDYYRCPTYYHLRHVERVESGAPESSALFFGTAMHLGVQAYLEGDDGAVVFEAAWEAHRDKPLLYYGRESWDSLAKDGEVLLTRFKRMHLKHIEPAFIEQKLEREHNGVILTGTVDTAGSYKGKRSVIDYKTSGKRYPQEKLVVNEQLSGYNFMLRGEPWKYEAEQHVYIVFRKTGVEGDAGIQVIATPVDEKFVMKRIDNMVAVAKQISKQKLLTKNTSQCIMGRYKCDYFAHCWGSLGGDKSGKNQ